MPSVALTTSAGGWTSSSCDAPRRRARAPRRAAPRLHLARQAELLVDAQSRPRSRAACRPTRRIGPALGASLRRRLRSRPGVTCQAVEAATSAGSRSSSVVVVTNACGSPPMRRTRCARRSGSSSEKTSSSSSSGGWPPMRVSRSSWASLRPGSRCAAGRARRTPTGPGRRSSKATSSRCGPTSVAPFQISFSAVSASRRRSASRGRLTLERRRVGDVAQREAILVRGDLAVGVGQRVRRARRGPRGASRRCGRPRR